MKYYRATARCFFVPAELMKTVPADGLHQRLRELLERSLASSIEGYAYTCEDGRPRVRVVRREARSSPPVEMWLEVRLSRADAAALAAELRTTIRKYAALAAPSRPSYLVHAALVET